MTIAVGNAPNLICNLQSTIAQVDGDYGKHDSVRALWWREPGRWAFLYRVRRGAGARSDWGDDTAAGGALRELREQQSRARTLLRRVWSRVGRECDATASAAATAGAVATATGQSAGPIRCPA